MHNRSKLEGFDQESSWEDSSVMRETVNEVKVSPVSFPILLINLAFPLIGCILMSIYLSYYPFVAFFCLSLCCFLVYPLVMLNIFGEMHGVWNRIKGASLIEGNHGKVVSFISFFGMMIVIPLWGIVPSLRNIKPTDDKLGVQEYNVSIVFKVILASVYFMFVIPVLQNFYWVLYTYECFGYSIRLGILKWLIAI